VDIAELTGETETPPGLVIAEVTECAPHPMAEKLTICTIDYGGEDTARVVCGAPNVRAGLKARRRLLCTKHCNVRQTGLAWQPVKAIPNNQLLEPNLHPRGLLRTPFGFSEAPATPHRTPHTRAHAHTRVVT